MITPKEKAKELIDKMYFSRRYKDGENYIPEQAWIHAKNCALIAVDEILNTIEVPSDRYIYWQEVKQELQSL